MKKIILVLVIFTGLAACKMSDKKAANTATTTIDSTAITTIQWLDSTPLNLGEVTDGQMVEVVFHFKNTGNKPLVISDVHPGCGCTDAEKPEGAIAPGEQGMVKAKFNSTGYKGRLASKYITVTANTEPKVQELNFNVQVK